MVEEQSTDLAPKMQDLIPPNVVIPISTLVTYAPFEDPKMENPKKKGYVYTNIINERQPTLRDIHYEKIVRCNLSIKTKMCPIELVNSLFATDMIFS